MIRRIIRIVKANIEHSSGKWKSSQPSESVHKKKQYSDDESFSTSTRTTSSENQQLIDDLAYFGLKPPSNLSEVKTARNREMLKYHPDKFASDPEKLQYANEIALVYNAAYERLEAYYSK
ncbi:MAG: hypothetical protein JW915_11130 [Chitinispirillaceae bacterium]|nr:hypothetical protein [Chitinispirillaceae bacterium]